MQLKDFDDYKNVLLRDLMTNKRIVELVNDSVPFEDSKSLIYKQVFPFEYIPETVEDGKTFICCDVDVDRVPGKTFLIPTIYIWIFSHKSKLVLPEGGVRTDSLCHEICKMINGSKNYGLGELNLYSVHRFAPMTDFQGKVMSFHAKEFNRTYDPKRSIPANRKDPNGND